MCEKKPRTLRTVAVVEKLNTSSNGNVRGAVIPYIDKGEAIKISRPINKLYPIECKTDEDFNVDVPVRDVRIQFVDDSGVSQFG